MKAVLQGIFAIVMIGPAWSEPRWTDYCRDFSERSCMQIRTVVEGKVTPRYCKPGFGVTPTTLSPEQLRICYVMPPPTEVVAQPKSVGGQQQSATSIVAKISQNYKTKLSALHTDFPTIVGYTNLPDETKLIVSISKPRLPDAQARLAAGLAMCEDGCIPASGPKGQTLGTESFVLSGAFSAGPFSWNGKPFRPGVYEVEIFLVKLPEESDPETVAQFEQWMERMKTPILTQSVTVGR